MVFLYGIFIWYFYMVFLYGILYDNIFHTSIRPYVHRYSCYIDAIISDIVCNGFSEEDLSYLITFCLTI